MKIIEKFVLILYSMIMIVISVVACLLVFNVINTEMLSSWINLVLDDSSFSLIVLGVSALFILMSIRCIFYRKRKEIKKSDETEILLENEAGKLLISKRSIENCVKNVINEVIDSNPSVDVTVDIDPADNLSVYAIIVLDKTEGVRDYTIGLQEKVQEQLKNDFDIDVKQVNIKFDTKEKVEIKKVKKDKKASLEENKDNEVVEVKATVNDVENKEN